MFYSLISYFGTMLGAVSAIRRKDPKTQVGKRENVIVLRTNDEVNADLARQWCDEHGLILQVTDQRDGLFPPEASATVIDLDHLGLTPSERAHLVERLCHALSHCPVAVASYNLEPPVRAALRDRGVLVYRRIDRQLFYGVAAVISCGLTDSAA
jgi:hypothetical protein